jgi:hypothetical protein
MGSSCSGSDGGTSRVLTLANVSLTDSGGFTVYVNGLALVPTVDYTVSHLAASTPITFINPMWNGSYIVVIYLLSGGAVGSGKYCTSTDVYTRTGLTTSEVPDATVQAVLLDAEAELEMITGRVFTNGNAMTEYITIGPADVMGNKQSAIQLRFWPVQSIAAFQLQDSTGAATATFAALTGAQVAAGTYATTDYWLELSHNPITNTVVPCGRLKLKTYTISQGTNIAYVSYTYGYSSVPQIIRSLSATMTGVRIWLAFLGGHYGQINSYSIPEQSVNKGDFYARARQNVDMLTEQSSQLLDRIGRRSRTLFFATGGPR